MQREIASSAQARAYFLGAELLLVVWDESGVEPSEAETPDAATRSRLLFARLDDGTRAAAQSSMRHLLETGGDRARVRRTALMHFTAGALAPARELHLEGAEVPAGVSASLSRADSAADGTVALTLAHSLLDGLDVAARGRLVRWLLRFFGGLASRVATSDAVPLARALVASTACGSEQLECIAALGDEHCLLGARLPEALGPARFVAVMGKRGIRISRTGEASETSSWVAVERALMRGAQTVVVACRHGMTQRRIGAGPLSTVSLGSWLRSRAESAGSPLADALRAIEPLTHHHPGLRDLARELSRRVDPAPRDAASTGDARGYPLGNELLLVVWDEWRAASARSFDDRTRDRSRPLIARRERGPRASAQSSLEHVLETRQDGQHRRCWMLAHFPGSALERTGEVRLDGPHAPGALSVLRGDPAAGDVAALAASLTDGLDVAARSHLARWLLRFCGGLASSVSTVGATPLARELVASAAIDTGDVDCVVPLDEQHCLLGARVPEALGAMHFVAVLGERGIRLSRIGEARGTSSWIAVDSSLLTDTDVCVIACSAGIALRRIDGACQRTVELLAWMKAHADDDGGKLDDVLTAIEPLSRRHSRLRKLGLELQLRFPRRRRAALETAAPVAAEVELAIADADGGVFLSGWSHDPHALIDRANVVTLYGERRAIELSSARFASRRGSEQCKELARTVADPALGFAVYVEGARPGLRCIQPRLDIILASGIRMRLVPSLQPHDPAIAKAAVLGSIPSSLIDNDTLERCISPAVSRLHAEHMRRDRIRDVHELGPTASAPRVSIIVPLYRNIDYLKTQLAAVALDPELAECEVILVLDSPEMARALLHLLEGLHRCYGLPLRLVVMRENFGFAAACNAGASISRGAELLMLNSDVLPLHRGWLGTLRRAMNEADNVAAVGPKLLYDDGSLQHAGMFFDRDARGRWVNRHYFKGFPAGYGPANVPREVPAVTGACLLVTEAAFREVGGFSEYCVYGDFEDSDLCLKLRRAGYQIRYEPRATLFHLERKSIALHREYNESAAWLYNSSQHEKRWAEEMTTLMGRFGLGAGAEERVVNEVDASSTEPQGRASNRRWGGNLSQVTDRREGTAA